jgi:hypothetical protein
VDAGFNGTFVENMLADERIEKQVMMADEVKKRREVFLDQRISEITPISGHYVNGNSAGREAEER